ncbi:TetR/AcrR family transcriptional regulator [Curtobacterium sp. ISL-83]|uniref:TetR/AcrR family transcriptional regulator n=1 Tax=Curtobacterium sp. ISL-83 TaxID=2819145 RepID=UPI001BEC4775|nr:TetR/AcrR family transcriptional regulator [Curtobacterium sp. ISL-83]MBT2503514.1 TetR/AcrR family transcriptional regulator [Curtobacterium sp. ISL-83]
MGRWEPDAQGRLLRAAFELFGERGYEATTTAQIAERAGLTKTTLFRLFADKREIVFQAQGALVALVQEGVAEAPADASPWMLLSDGLRRLSSAHTEEQRGTGRILDSLLLTSAELNERAVQKRFVITAALETALIKRHVDPAPAGILADVGMRAYYAGYAVWVAEDGPEPMTRFVLDQLEQYADAVDHLYRDRHPGP